MAHLMDSRRGQAAIVSPRGEIPGKFSRLSAFPDSPLSEYLFEIQQEQRFTAAGLFVRILAVIQNHNV